MTSKKIGAERVAYEPAITVKRKAEMESTTMLHYHGPWGMKCTGYVSDQRAGYHIVPDVTRVKQRLSREILKIKTQWLP
jgi:hypothetical protein